TPGASYYALALLLTGIGSVGAALNFVVTTLRYRAPGMGMRDLPLFVWMVFVNAFIILGALPPLNAALSLLLLDLLMDAHFFRPAHFWLCFCSSVHRSYCTAFVRGVGPSYVCHRHGQYG